MRLVLAIVILACSSQLAAQQHYHELEFHQSRELLSWCETEARAYFVGKGVETYQWRGRHYDKGNVFFVEGKIRASGSDVPVVCSVARGARERYAVIEIDQATVSD